MGMGIGGQVNTVHLSHLSLASHSDVNWAFCGVLENAVQVHRFTLCPEIKAACVSRPPQSGTYVGPL